MNRIKKVRKSRGVSQQELANKTGLTQTQISKLELEKRKLTTDKLEKIKDALNCTFADLLGSDISEEIIVQNKPPVLSSSPIGAGELGLKMRRIPKEIYTTRICCDALEPRIKTGEMITVDPTLPPRKDDEILVFFKTTDSEEVHAQARIFQEIKNNKIFCRLHNSETEEFDLAETAAIHVIIGVSFSR